MLAVDVEFLTGRYVATSQDDRNAPEWPPHPARLFSALVAEWGGAAEQDPQEEAMLRRLETFGAPSIAAGEATARTVTTHYVPVNDPSVIGQALWRALAKAEDAHARLGDPATPPKARDKAERDLSRALDVAQLVTGAPGGDSSSPMPEQRMKQPRTFPGVTLEASGDTPPTATFVWPNDSLSPTEEASLDALLARVTRLGHSSSLVNCRVRTAAAPTPAFEPVAGRAPAGITSGVRLRTVGPGQLDALTTSFARHRGSSPRTLPSDVTRYRLGADEQDPPLSALAGDWFAFEIRPRLGGRAGAALTEAVRDGLLAVAPRDDREAVREAFVVALPDVGHPHARGDVLGFAILLPRGLDASMRSLVHRAIGTALPDGRRLDAPAVSVQRQPSPVLAALRRERWAGLGTRGTPGALRPARVWVTATPALVAASPPRGLRHGAWDEWASDWLAESVVRSGLPRPEVVTLDTQPRLAGALPARSYPPIRQAGRVGPLVHAQVEFEDPVVGPLIVGGWARLGFGMLFPTEMPS